MTRVETVFSQVLELTPDERCELFQLMDRAFESETGETDSPEDKISPERMTEIRRRYAEFEAGTSVIDSKESVMRRLDQVVKECQS